MRTRNAQPGVATEILICARWQVRPPTVVTLVGDADQTIYGFRGTKHDVLNRIGSHFGCMSLVLPTNYRCGERIVAIARDVIEASAVREGGPLLAARSAGCGVVRALCCSGRTVELEAIAQELQQLQRRRELSSVAVLCRLRQQALRPACICSTCPAAWLHPGRPLLSPRWARCAAC